MNDVKDSFSNDQFILLTTDNTEITRFEFSLLGTNSEGSPPKCVIEFIDSGKSFELEYFASLKKRVIATNGKRENLKGVFYIAFGVGDNLSYWSGFNSFTLLGAQIFQDFNQPKTIQLTFTVGVGYHNIFDSLSSDLIDDDILTKIDFKTGPIDGSFYGSSFGDLALTNKDDSFNKNSDLLVKYLLGFNPGDSLFKLTINTFLRTIFNQEANVFIVSDDLINLCFHRNYVDNGGVKGGEKNLGAREQYALFIKELKNLEPYTKMKNGGGPVARATAQRLVPYYDTLKKVVGKNLNIQLTGDPVRVPYYYRAICTILFESATGEDFENAEEVKNTLLSLLKNIKLGLENLFPGKAKTPCSLVRESDKVIVSNFISLFSEKAKKVLGLSEELPIIFLGNQKLIRAMLYGESFDVNVSPNVTNNTYPISEDSFAYLNSSWRTRDLYGSHPKEQDIRLLENLLTDTLNKEVSSGAFAYDNFPIFTYNMFNPNVLSVSVTENNAFLSLIKAGINETYRRYDELAKYTKDIEILNETINDLESKLKDLRDEAKAKNRNDVAIRHSKFRELLEELIADRYGTGGSYGEYSFGEVRPPNTPPTGPVDPNNPFLVFAELGRQGAWQRAGKELREVAKELADKDKLGYLSSKIAREYSDSQGRTRSFHSHFELREGEDFQGYISFIRNITLHELGLSQTPLTHEDKYRKQNIDLSLKVLMGEIPGVSEQFGTIGIGGEVLEEAPFRGVDETKLKLIYYALLETKALALLSDPDEKNQLPPYVKQILEVIDAGDYDYRRFLAEEYGDIAAGSNALKDEVPRAKVRLKGAENSLETTKLYDDLLQFVDKIPMTVEIKTLPFFSLSNFFWLGYPCILFARRPKLLGNTEDYAIDYLLSGSYKILGMKHEISGDTCESSFVLQKQATIDAEPEEEKTKDT